MNGENEAENAASKIVSIIERATDKAVLICFSIKFVLAIAIYALLKRFVNEIAAELWMTGVLAYALYSYELVISAFVKVDVMKKLLDESLPEKDESDDEEKEDGTEVP